MSEPHSTDRDLTAELTMVTHRRDLDMLARGLTEWLRRPLDADASVNLNTVHVPDGGGMSNVTLIAEASWSVRGQQRQQKLVVRLPPDDASFPVFPSYDLRLQADVMVGVRAHTDVPVPRVIGLEESKDVIDTPFLVMEHAEGTAPADNPPYVFCGWLYEMASEGRQRLQENTLDLLARIHSIPEPAVLFPQLCSAGVDPLRSHVNQTRAYYEWTRRFDRMHIPVLERTFDWLEDHWPSDQSETVLSWGDARPGNVLYEGSTPRAVLDWEMAALGPRELDLGWFIFIHRFFQDLAEFFGLPGLPDMARREDVVATYESLTGYHPRDLDWHVVYAALRYGVILSQVKRRMIHFGEDSVPEDINDYVMHRVAIEKLLDGTYEWPAS